MKIEDIQVGDKVVVVAGGGMGYSHDRVDTVTKVIATRITISSGKQFTRSHGRQIGGGGHWSSYIHAADENEIARVEEEQRHLTLTRKLRCVKWEKLSIAALEKIWENVLTLAG
jgi:hypothetical protein